MKTEARRSIKREIFFSLSLTAGVVIFIFISLRIVSLYRFTVESAGRYIHKENAVVSAYAAGYFTEIINTVEVLSVSTDVLNAAVSDVSRSHTLDLFRIYDKVNPNITYIYSGYPSKKLVINDYTPPPGYDPTERPWYKAAVDASGAVYVGLPYVEIKTGEWLISTGKVLKSGDRVRGVVTIDCSLQAVAKVLNGKLDYKTGFNFVLDRNGVVIIHSDTEAVGKKIAHWPDFEGKGYGKAVIGNESCIAAYSDLHHAGWRIVTAVKISEILSPLLLEMAVFISALVILTLVMIFIQSLLIGRNVAEPVSAVSRRLELLAKGDLSVVPLEVLSRNEIGSMAESFNMFLETTRGLKNDIAERKKIEEQLRAKSEELERYFNSSLDLLCIADTDGRFIRLNPEWEKVLGYSVDELGGRNFLDFVHPDDIEGTLGAMSRLDAQEQVLSFENRYRHNDGSYRWIEWRSKPQGKIIYAVARDITERKLMEEALRESEQKLKTLFRSMTEMVVLHDLIVNDEGCAVDYRITDCNEAFTSITGIKREDAVGRPATEVFNINPPPYLEEYSLVAISGIPFEYTAYYEPLDRHFSISAVSPKKNSFATITTDITGIKKVQDIISAKNRELENYLYIASHDLRSPLVNIQGFSRRLQKQTEAVQGIINECSIPEDKKNEVNTIFEEGIPKTLNYIFTSVNRMDALLNGLLQVSRTGRTAMNIKEIDMNQLMHSIAAGYNYQLTEINASLEISGLPPCFGDQNLLNQLFSNIIGNAIKYRDRNRPLKIEVSGREDFRKAVYSVRDNGTGIAEKYLEKIWDVFYRVNPGHDDAGEGLGLSIVRRIAEMHDGNVRVESEHGTGSVFIVELQRNSF